MRAATMLTIACVYRCQSVAGGTQFAVKRVNLFEDAKHPYLVSNEAHGLV